ncbi:UBX domain-containing protein 8 [Bombina bombina]|uniref:UBX domain-containing protein 8 n=1 Tax=Bombina bombina TaxID=8345 RepID=UPI00235A6BEC|nr:UBX domain-containing protein 8 [Bombina bombina]
MVGNRTFLLCLLGVSSVIYLGLWRHEIDIAVWAGRIFLFLGLLTLIISVLTPSVPLSRPSVSLSDDEIQKRQRIARKEQQEQLSRKASSYLETVMNPRAELKLKKREKHFYTMTGETWKLTPGQRLGEGEESGDNSNDASVGAESPNNEALSKRKLPEHVTKPAPKAEQPQPKKIITLPEEPSSSEEGVVTIALRCPSGRVFRRRFYKSCSSIILLDWMMKIGYHSAIYTLSTPFPRCHLELRKDLCLENVGILKDTVLNVEEKDPS